MFSYKGAPEANGRLWVIPVLGEDFQVCVDIVGDRDGLQYLADCLAYLARFDQNAPDAQPGTHAHLHFYPRRPHTDWGDLGAHSCPLVVTRAEAAVTGEISPELEATERQAEWFAPDKNPPREWLGYAESALALAEHAARGPAKPRRSASALAAHAIYCALMAGLRARDIPVPELPDYALSGVINFVPEDLSLPLDTDRIDDLLYYEDLGRPRRTAIPYASKREIDAGLEAARELIGWAAESIRAMGS